MQRTLQTGLVWDERYMWYDFGSYTGLFDHHPHLQPGTSVESPEAKRRIINLLATSGLLAQLRTLAPQAVGEGDLQRVHTADYVATVKRLSSGGGGNAGPTAPLPANGYDIAALAVGGTSRAIDAVLTGEVSNAYALVRPPGHHAERDHGMGLCVFANAAVAVKKAMAEHRLARVAIVDWDAHHGNGTESAFYHDPNVLTISIHQDQIIHGRGFMEHRGVDQGAGYNINLPMPPGTGTGAYLAAFDRVVLPAIVRFKPDLIVVASGLDACSADPTARLMLHSDGYRQLTQRMLQVADAVCGGRLVMTHEGGYDPTMVPFCALAVFEELSGIRTAVVDPFLPPPPADTAVDYHALQPHQEVIIARAEELLAAL